MSSLKSYVYENIGERIRFYRLKSGLTQEQLSEILGKGDKYIGHIERKERFISLKILIKLMDYWHLQPKEFFDFNNKYKF